MAKITDRKLGKYEVEVIKLILDKSPVEKFSELMTAMEKDFDIPLLNDPEWNERNRDIIHLYKLISDYRKVDQEEFNRDMEEDWLNKLINLDNVEISRANRLDISAVYYITVENSYDYREELKELGYIWKGYNIKGNSWNKKILASDRTKELGKLEQLKGVKIKTISK
ncbi:MAG: hypothetical protein WCZ27_08020 [Tissierellaceae bacterium]